MMNSLTALRDARRRGILLKSEQSSGISANLDAEWQLLESTLEKLANRDNAAHVFASYRKAVKDIEFSKPEQQATNYLIEAVVRNRLGQPQLAHSALRKANALHDQISHVLRIDLLIEAGQIYAWQGNTESALSQYLLALNLAQQHDDQTGEALIWAAIARLHLEVLANDRAIHYFKSALLILRDWQASRERIRCLKDLAEAHLNLNQAEAALDYLNNLDDAELALIDDYLQFVIQSLKLQCQTKLAPQAVASESAVDELNTRVDEADPYQLAQRDFTLAMIYATHDATQAITAMQNARTYYDNNGLAVPEWKADMLLAELYANVGDNDNATTALQNALQIATTVRSPIMHEQSLLLQSKLKLPARIEEEQQTTISDDKSGSDHGYNILKTLGNGAFGIVYHAYDVLRDRDVALKKFDLQRIYDSRRRDAVKDNIRRELQATSQIDHPGILKPIAYGTDNSGDPYVVMPLITGQTFRQWLQTDRSLETRLRVIADACYALAEAHRVEVVHRDLKPENVMLTDQDEPVLVDFGISSFAPEESDPARAVGTLPYMAPEHHNGADARPAMDIFAMGVMLYESVTGQWPWQERCPETSFRYALKQKAIKKALASTELKGPVQDLLCSMLARNPDKRPSAEIIATRISETLAD